MSDPSPTERTRLLSSIEQQEEQGPKEHHATWAALKPFVRPLLAANFISIVCGLNDGSIVGVLSARHTLENCFLFMIRELSFLG